MEIMSLYVHFSLRIKFSPGLIYFKKKSKPLYVIKKYFYLQETLFSCSLITRTLCSLSADICMFSVALFDDHLSNWWMVVMLCLICIDARQMPDWNRFFTAETVQWKQRVKPSLIGGWEVISILVFCVLQGRNMPLLLMMSLWMKKTRFPLLSC